MTFDPLSLLILKFRGQSITIFATNAQIMRSVVIPVTGHRSLDRFSRRSSLITTANSVIAVGGRPTHLPTLTIALLFTQ